MAPNPPGNPLSVLEGSPPVLISNEAFDFADTLLAGEPDAADPALRRILAASTCVVQHATPGATPADVTRIMDRAREVLASALVPVPSDIRVG